VPSIPGRSAGRPRSFDRDEVLYQAMQQFFRYGYGGTTSRRLQVATGLTAPSLYNVFGSKRELFLAVLRLYTKLGVRDLFADLAQGRAGLHELRAFLDRMWRSLEAADRPTGCLVLNTRGEFGGAEPDILAECDVFTGHQVRYLGQAFQRAALLGEIPRGSVEQRLMQFRLALNGFQHLVRSNGLDDEARAGFRALQGLLADWQDNPGQG